MNSFHAPFGKGHGITPQIGGTKLAAILFLTKHLFG